MPTIADLQVKFSAETSGLDSGVGKAQGLIGGLTSGAKGLATVAGGMVLGTAVAQVVGGVGQLASAGIDFGRQMANVNSIAQLSGQGIGDLTDQVFKLSGDPRITQGPAELAAGLYNIYSSGFQGAEGLTILEAAGVAATAGVTSTDVAAKAITQTLNAYGMGADQAGRVSDVLFKTVDQGVITFEQLAANMGNTLPAANALGVSVEELGASYALMTLKGVGASQAETQISALMRSALNPTEAMSTAMQEYGDGTAEATIANRGLKGFMQAVMKASGGSKEKLMDLLGTQEAMNAALILGAENGADFNEMLKEMENSSGATNAALEKQMESSAFAIDKMRQSVERAAVMVMGALAPAITFGANAITNFISGAITFVDELKLMHETGGAFLDAWIDKFPRAIQPAIQLLYDLIDPLGDVFDAFQALAEGNFDEVFDELREAGAGFADAFSTLGSSIWDAISGIDYGSLASTLWDFLKTAVTTVASAGLQLGTIVLNAAAALGGEIAEAARDIYGWIKGKLFGGGLVGDGTGGPEPGNGVGDITLSDVVLAAGAKLGGEIANVAKDVWGWIKGKLGVGGSTGGISVPNPFGGTSGNKITLGDVALDAKVSVTELISNIKSKLGEVVEPVKARFREVMQQGIGGVSAGDIMTGRWSFDFGNDLGKRLGDAIGNAIGGMDWRGLFGKAVTIQAELMSGLGQAILGGIAALAIMAGNANMMMFGFLKGLLVDSVDWSGLGSQVKEKISGVFSTLFQGAQDRVGGASEFGLKFVKSLSDALTTALNDGGNFALDIIQAIKAKFDGMDIQPDAILTFGGKIGNAISGAAKRGIEALSGSEMIESLKSKIDGLPFDAGSILGLGANVGNAISGAVKRGVEALSGSEIMTAITTKINGITGFTADLLSGIGGAVAGAVKGAILAGMGILGISKEEVLNAFGLGFLSRKGNVRDGGGDATERNTMGGDGGLGVGMGQVVAQAQALATQVQASMTAFTTAIQTAYTTANASLVSIGVSFATAQTFVTSAVTAMSAQVRSQFQQMAQGANQAVQQMRAQVQAAMQQMAAAAQAAIQQMRSQVQSGMQQMASASQSAMNQFSQAVRSGFQQAVSAAQQGVSGIRAAVNSIGSLYGQGASIGSSLGQGIAAGIRGQIASVAAAAAALVTAAINAANAAGSISSPSRETMKTGNWLVEGLILPMVRRSAEVSAAFANLIPQGGGSGTIGQTFSAESSALAPVYIFMLDSRSLQEVMSGAEKGSIVYDQIGSRGREISLGLGFGGRR